MLTHSCKRGCVFLYLVKLWVIAVLTLYTSWIAPGKSFCYRLVRQDVQILYGHRYDRYHKATAHLSYLAWKKSKWARDPKLGIEPGDIMLWKGTSWNPAGHAAIALPNWMLAENSTVHWPGPLWGKGFRDRRRVRACDLIVRLPPRYVS